MGNNFLCMPYFIYAEIYTYMSTWYEHKVIFCKYFDKVDESCLFERYIDDEEGF
jgi:hypothetical protein